MSSAPNMVPRMVVSAYDWWRVDKASLVKRVFEAASLPEFGLEVTFVFDWTDLQGLRKCIVAQRGVGGVVANSW